MNSHICGFKSTEAPHVDNPKPTNPSSWSLIWVPTLLHVPIKLLSNKTKK